MGVLYMQDQFLPVNFGRHKNNRNHAKTFAVLTCSQLIAFFFSWHNSDSLTGIGNARNYLFTNRFYE